MEGEGVKRVVEQLTKAGVKPAAIVKDKDGQTLPLFEQAFPGIQENLDLNHTLVAFKARVEAAKKAGNIGITSLVFRCQITNNNDQKKKKTLPHRTTRSDGPTGGATWSDHPIGHCMPHYEQRRCRSDNHLLAAPCRCAPAPSTGRPQRMPCTFCCQPHNIRLLSRMCRHVPTVLVNNQSDPDVQVRRLRCCQGRSKQKAFQEQDHDLHGVCLSFSNILLTGRTLIRNPSRS
jgi:hypothetical protein